MWERHEIREMREGEKYEDMEEGGNRRDSGSGQAQASCYLGGLGLGWALLAQVRLRPGFDSFFKVGMPWILTPLHN